MYSCTALLYYPVKLVTLLQESYSSSALKGGSPLRSLLVLGVPSGLRQNANRKRVNPSAWSISCLVTVKMKSLSSLAMALGQKLTKPEIGLSRLASI